MRSASLLLLLAASLSQAAEVYLQPPLHFPTKLSPRNGWLALSHHLGLESFDNVGTEYSRVLKEQTFVGKLGDGILLSIDETVSKDVIPSSWEITFSSDIPTQDIVPTYLSRARSMFYSIFSTSRRDLQSNRLLDLFSVSSPATDAFLNEVSALSAFIDSESFGEKFGAFELSGLSQIRQTYGTHSEQYQLASRTARAILESALSAPNLQLALVVSDSSSLHALKRQATQAPLPGPTSAVPQQPIGGISTCFETADACSNSTNTCSGRGSCVPATKAGRTCFVCACSQTKSDNGKVQTWVGEACERKDISGPFVLITGTVIALILTIIGSVSLLYSVGSQKLPSTLTATAITAKRE